MHHYLRKKELNKLYNKELHSDCQKPRCSYLALQLLAAGELGLYNPVKKVQLEILREGFDQDPIDDPEFLDWQTYCEGREDDHPELCPICGKRLINRAISGFLKR